LFSDFLCCLKGGAIGAGLFVGTGNALSAGGPGALVRSVLICLPEESSISRLMALQLVCYLTIGVMLLMTMQALGEMAVLYPINGAFFDYCLRFIDPSW
jgi:amino acid transporter